MRLSELRGVLFDLHSIASERGNQDPIVELFHVVDGENYSLTIDIEAINNDPHGQVTRGGSIHLPLTEIITRGWIVTFVSYTSTSKKSTVVMQGESKEQVTSIFGKHFPNYKIVAIVNEE